VAVVRYQLNGRARKGVCSTFFADRVGPETKVPVFVHRSPSFKLPADGTKPIIMVGPGTGVAPFRAFLEERRAIGATGRNWLFFGDQRAHRDFLYREELEAMKRDGFLTKLDTAFSRDQPQKIYVQDRMIENAREIWSWLQEGGYFYVCGDATRMAKDVDTALHKIAEAVGSLSSEQAADYVKQLKSKKRYLRDVY
jgi:sulfite reductase (NADPH) flavoprotein alpha-component